VKQGRKASDLFLRDSWVALNIRLFRKDFLVLSETYKMNKYILVFLLFTTITSINANAAMIDDFNGGKMTVIATDTQTKSYSHAFGGTRTINIEKEGLLGASAAVLPSLGIFAHNADALTSATSIITWKSDLGIDLREDSTQIAFALDILSIDQGKIEIMLSVTDALGGFDSFSFLGARAGLNFFNFTSFSSIDFLYVNEISLTMIGDTASDLTIKSLSTVPTPSVLVLLGMGLIAFRFNYHIKA